jgi:hypothetical protein
MTSGALERARRSSSGRVPASREGGAAPGAMMPQMGQVSHSGIVSRPQWTQSKSHHRFQYVLVEKYPSRAFRPEDLVADHVPGRGRFPAAADRREPPRRGGAQGSRSDGHNLWGCLRQAALHVGSTPLLVHPEG